jgi:hypothetical protein
MQQTGLACHLLPCCLLFPHHGGLCHMVAKNSADTVTGIDGRASAVCVATLLQNSSSKVCLNCGWCSGHAPNSMQDFLACIKTRPSTKHAWLLGKAMCIGCPCLLGLYEPAWHQDMQTKIGLVLLQDRPQLCKLLAWRRRAGTSAWKGHLFPLLISA